jgi:DMSO reductase anchor subunit
MSKQLTIQSEKSKYDKAIATFIVFILIAAAIGLFVIPAIYSINQNASWSIACMALFFFIILIIGVILACLISKRMRMK